MTPKVRAAAKFTRAVQDKNNQVIEISTINEEGIKSKIILTADFCHYCKDDLATEFAAFMVEKGYDIITKGKK